MPKNVEDIVPAGSNPERRSIRDVPMPEGRRKNLNLIDSVPPPGRRPVSVPPPIAAMHDVVHAAPVQAPQEFADRRVEDRRVEDRRAPGEPRITTTYKDFADEPAPIRASIPVRSKNNKGFGKRVGVLAVLLLVIVDGIVAFSILAGATLTYTPKSAPVAFNNDTYTARKTADSVSGSLLFSVVELSGDKSTTVPASGQVQVSDKATGKIIVYNDYSTDAQKLVKTTRFQTADGKIFRTPTDITIPGKHTENGTDVPGSVEVTVVADIPGADYNIGLSDFTIPGLKGDPRYSTVYARSKTAMSGGLVGMKASVSDADLATAKNTLEEGIKADLLQQARAQVPADYILFPNLVTITYDLLPTGSSTDTTASVGERGNFSGVMFKKADLATFLAAQKIQNVAGPVTLPDVSGLDAIFTSAATPELLQADSVTFMITGSTTVEWVTDEKSLAGDLAGKAKSDLDTVLKAYPSIQSASAVVRPFWKSSFPNDPAKIKIVKNG